MSKKLVDSAHISFRITNDAVAEELALRAQASGSSPNLIARELVTEALCRVDRTTEQFNELDATLQRLMDRVDRLDRIEQRLLRGIHVLLRYGGKLEPNLKSGFSANG